MAKRPKLPPPPRRGRPPKPGGAIPHVEVQRAYRARLKAAGKGVRTVRLDAIPAEAHALPGSAEIPDFDPATQMICDRELFEGMRDKLHHALLKLELRDERLAQTEKRNAWLESELKLQEQHHTNSLKELITLRQQLAAALLPPKSPSQTE